MTKKKVKVVAEFELNIPDGFELYKINTRRELRQNIKYDIKVIPARQ